MKSLQELINDADDIQKRLAQHKVDLYEYAESLNENHVAVDIDKLMVKASHCKIERHILQDNNDDFVISAYLQLLLSVAQVNITNDKGENHPVLYACRIAVALPKIPDMNMLFQSSMILDEKGIGNCVDVLSQHKLAEIFVFDALMMTCSYDTGNERKFEYIAELATLMNIDKNTINEILIIVETAVARKKDLEHNFEYIKIESFIHIFNNLQNNSNINVSDNNYLLMSYIKKTKVKVDWNNGMLTARKFILLRNVMFDYRENAPSDEPLLFCNNNDVHIDNCSFVNAKRSSIEIADCKKFLIQNSLFENATISKRGMTSSDSMYGALLALRKVGILTIYGCNFRNITSVDSDDVIVFCWTAEEIIIENSSFIDCNSDNGKRGYTDNLISFNGSRNASKIITKKCIVKKSAPLNRWKDVI